MSACGAKECTSSVSESSWQCVPCPLHMTSSFSSLLSLFCSVPGLSPLCGAPAGRCSAVTEAGHPGPFRAGPGALGLAWGVAAAALCTECVLVIRGAPPQAVALLRFFRNRCSRQAGLVCLGCAPTSACFWSCGGHIPLSFVVGTVGGPHFAIASLRCVPVEI